MRKTTRYSDMIKSISGVAATHINQYTTEKVYSDGKGGHKVEKTFYTVTLYDSNGILNSITNTHSISYRV